MAFFGNNAVNYLNLHYGIHSIALGGGGAFFMVYLLDSGVPVPANVARAIDYYQAGGWGSPLTPGQGFRGTLANHNVAGDQSISHFNIAENPRIRAEVIREIKAVPQAAAARAQRPPPPARKPAVR